MARFFISSNEQGDLSFKVLIRFEDDDGVIEGTVKGSIPLGMDTFGMTFAELKHCAETQRYFDYEEPEQLADLIQYAESVIHSPKQQTLSIDG